MQQVTLGLSLHRPEMIPLIFDRMECHEAIILEEPPDTGFERMLAGRLAVDEYLMQLDVEYPAFSRNMCYLLRELRARGKQIFQVEPFLEILWGVHELFAEGHHPAKLKKNSIQYPVYLVERNATRALLDYYQTVMAGSFDDTIGAIIRFARMDAARFNLRDSLRAQALKSLIGKFTSTYVEAGMMHYPLYRLLGQQVSPSLQVRPLFLVNRALKKIGKAGHLYGPGDLLTLLYIFHPKIAASTRQQLLAARSLIYTKIIAKEEKLDSQNTFPHLRDELDCIRTVQRLSLNDCRRLFPLVRRAKTSDAHQIVGQYLSERALHLPI